MVDWTAEATPWLIVQAPYTLVQYEIVRDEDWSGQLPGLQEGEEPLDLTDKELHVYIKSSYGDADTIMLLSTETGEIVVNDAENGDASFDVPRADVIAGLQAGKRVWFCVLEEDGAFTELWRGPFIVHPGEVTT